MLSKLQMYRAARLVLNVEEGVTDENDLEFLHQLLAMVNVERTDLDTLLGGRWDPGKIDTAIWNNSQ